MKRRCYVKIILELHAVTCPGVWLCTSGYLELTIKSLGYFFKSGPMEPRFPMLCHDVFIMEGYFPTVRNFNELDKVLATENVEVSLWQNGCRLAYFLGKLKQLICNTYVENSNIQILMNPSHNFPGIIAPKLELLTYVYFENRSHIDEVQHTCHKFVQMQKNPDTTFIPNKTIQTQPDERTPESRIQRPVCHTKSIGQLKLEKGKPDWRIPQSCRKCTTNLSNSDNDRRFSKETIPSLKFPEGSSNSSARVESRSLESGDSSKVSTGKSSSNHSDKCDVCRTYDRTFRVSE